MSSKQDVAKQAKDRAELEKERVKRQGQKSECSAIYLTVGLKAKMRVGSSPSCP